MPKFVAVDGEGYTNPAGIHLYNLLGASDGSYIRDNDGLKTRDCFDYLLGLKERFPGNVFVSFYFSYDVNKILAGISENARIRMADKGYVYLADKNNPVLGYRIEYNPKKFVTISRVWQSGNKFKTIQSVKIYDVFGFFQSSFLGALYTFQVGDLKELEFIAQMKLDRSEFDTESIEEIVRYNQLECTLLVTLMERVSECLERVGINLSQWHGAGAVAGAVLRREGIKAHLWTPTDPELQVAVMGAYFGGRVQCLKVGKFSSVHGYDINSAYPSAMNTLCSLSGCEVTRNREYREGYPYSVYRLNWQVPTDNVLTPFPFRNANGTIEYPYLGSGCYWEPEVSAAMDVYGRDCFEIVSAYHLEVDTSSRPFGFIEEMYLRRKELKVKGDMAQIVLKLALNSLYGKTAQGIGYKNSPPPYQCYSYAGLITSITRSKMLRAAARNQYSIISFATDGILSKEPLELDERDALGAWEYAKYDRAFMLKPGFYRLSKGDKHIAKVRGFPSRNINFDAIEEIWQEEGLAGHIYVPSTQFIGLKSASASRPWGQWVESSRKLSFYPSRGVPEPLPNEVAYQIVQEFVKDGESMPYYKGIHAIYDERQYSELEYFADNID